MSGYSGPEIADSGLVLSVDMGNTDKSFKGKPVNNIFLTPTPDAAGNVTFISNGTGTFQRVTSGTYGGYTIQPSDIVYSYALGVPGCHYHGIRIDSPVANQYYTFSFDYMVSANVTGYPVDNYIANIEIYDTTNGSGWVWKGGGAVTDDTTSIVGVWKTATLTTNIPIPYGLPISAFFSLYPGGCGASSTGKLANTGVIMYKNAQVEIGPVKSPFTANSSPRSNTQGLIDLTGINTLASNNVTYSSDGTYSFNGVNNYISVSNNANLLFTGTSPYTLEAWIYPGANPGVNNYTGVFNRENADTGYRDGYNIFVLGSAGTTMYLATERFYGAANNTSHNIFYTSDVATLCNVWSHVVVTYDGNVLSMFRNGSLVGTTISTANITNTTKTLDIGKKDINYFNGKISKAQVYNRALTPKEVKQNFNANRGRFGL